MAKRIVIVGGGFAGLAAGTALAEAGANVLLLEARNHLGGRAYSFIDRATGDVVDNGQHLFMRCYRETMRFLDRIGTADRLKFQARPRVEFLDVERRSATFDCPPLPAPLNVAAGLLRLGGVSLGDRLRALRVGRAIKSGRQPSPGLLTVEQWMDHLGQSDRMRERFWYPMATATLNEDPRIASAAMLWTVLRESFAEGNAATSLGIARTGLSDLYTTAASEFIRARGGEILTGAPVQSLEIVGDRLRFVRLKNGRRINGDAFILAVPPNSLIEILPEDLKGNIGSLAPSPILSINLWFDRPITDSDFIGLIGTNIQWLFNRAAFVPARGPGQIALIISAAREFMNRSRRELVEMAMSELLNLMPAVADARLVHSLIVRERFATISHTVESDSLRPRQETRVGNLFLAGDWTATGLPATIESAAQSGHRAADMILG